MPALVPFKQRVLLNRSLHLSISGCLQFHPGYRTMADAAMRSHERHGVGFRVQGLQSLGLRVGFEDSDWVEVNHIL